MKRSRRTEEASWHTLGMVPTGYLPPYRVECGSEQLMERARRVWPNAEVVLNRDWANSTSHLPWGSGWIAFANRIPGTEKQGGG